MTPELIPGQLLLERALGAKKNAPLAYLHGPSFYQSGFNLSNSM